MQISELIVFKNNRFILINKPAGVPVVPDLTKDVALTQIVAAYLKHPVQAVHRIDRAASGLVVLAQGTKAMSELSALFADQSKPGDKSDSVHKTYLAVVKQAPEASSATLTHYLKKETGKNKMRCFDKPQPGAQEAVLSYEVIGKSDQYHLLQIKLHTGRQHQIRAQLEAIGSPIKGDNKYGFARSNADRSIHLHAWKMSFTDPVSGELLDFEAPIRRDDPVWAFFADLLAKPQA